MFQRKIYFELNVEPLTIDDSFLDLIEHQVHATPKYVRARLGVITMNFKNQTQ